MAYIGSGGSKSSAGPGGRPHYASQKTKGEKREGSYGAAQCVRRRRPFTLPPSHQGQKGIRSAAFWRRDNFTCLVALVDDNSGTDVDQDAALFELLIHQ